MKCMILQQKILSLQTANTLYFCHYYDVSHDFNFVDLSSITKSIKGWTEIFSSFNRKDVAMCVLNSIKNI